MQEEVVLVDQQNRVIGVAPKDTIHTKETPLHRGFSLFVFNRKGELLVTKRAISKKTFPGVWTNSVCGHPAPKESVVDAALRRLKKELGISGVLVKEVAPYRYRFADNNGIVENEICPILVAYYDGDISVDPNEVGEWQWIPWEDFLLDSKNNPEKYSPWSREEAQILIPIV